MPEAVLYYRRYAMNRRILAAAVSAMLVITAFPAVPLSAFADFENTHINTGDQREDIVAVAETQIGYHEDPEGETPYNHFIGALQGCPADGYGYAWCHSFVSWCAYQAGISRDIVPRVPGTYTGSDFFRLRGRWENAAAYGGSYVPQKGDVIYFSNDHEISRPGHVGIVTGCYDGIVYTIEGNSADEVRAKEYALTDEYIIGYGVPEYDSIPDEATVPVCDENIPPVTDGIYIIENCGTMKELNYAYGWKTGGGYYPMIAADADGSPEQLFIISSPDGGAYRLASGYDSSISVNVWAETEADIRVGCDITGFKTEDNNTQKFRLLPVGDGEYVITSAVDESLVFGLAERNGYTHVVLQRYRKDNIDQRWRLIPQDTEPPTETTEPVTESAAMRIVPEEITMRPGDRCEALIPGQTGESVRWTSSNTKSATVKDGVITAIAAGEAEIYAVCGDRTSKCRVIVEDMGSSKATVKGDANCDGKVNVSDAVAVMQYISNQTKYPLIGPALENADCDGVAGISGNDAITIQKFDAGILGI